MSMRTKARSTALTIPIALMLLTSMLFAQNAAAPRPPSGDPPWMVNVGPIPEQLRTDYRLNPFYKKSAMIDGIPILGSQNVSDFAFRECAWTIHHMLDCRTVALDALVKAKVRIGIIAVRRYKKDIQENQNARMM